MHYTRPPSYPERADHSGVRGERDPRCTPLSDDALLIATHQKAIDWEAPPTDISQSPGTELIMVHYTTELNYSHRLLL